MTTARLSQAVIEVARAPVASARLSQVVVEVLRIEAPAVKARLSQVVVEVLRSVPVVARDSQVVVEVLRSSQGTSLFDMRAFDPTALTYVTWTTFDPLVTPSSTETTPNYIALDPPSRFVVERVTPQ